MMSNAPLISVVIACFNVAPYLAETLESVLAQTLQDFEVLLVDDGSTDNTLAIVQGFVERDKRITVISLHRNKGVVVARNTALARARGQYIAMLDGDDIWTPDALHTRYGLATRYPRAGVVTTDFACFTDTLPDKPVGKVGLGPRARLAFSDCFATGEPQLIEEPFDLVATTHFAWVGATLVKRTAMMTVDNFVPDFAGPEDTLLWLRLANRSAFVFLPRVTSFYRQRAGSAVSLLSAKGPKEMQYLTVLTWVRSKAEFGRQMPIIRKLTAECHYICTNYYQQLDRNGPAAVHAARAVQNQPMSGRYWRSLAVSCMQAVRRLVNSH